MRDPRMKNLEHLLERKKKADLLSGRERQKWKKHIEQLDREIAQLRRELGLEVFVPSDIIRAICEMYHSKIMMLWGDPEKVNEFFKQETNRDLETYLKEQMEDLVKVSQWESLAAVQDALKRYGQALDKLHRLFHQTQTTWYREVLDIEQAYNDCPWINAGGGEGCQ